MKAILDSRQLLAVRVLARTGSFTGAGKELFLTQSAVSHAIKALETELECALFERTGRGVVLTENGRRFLPYAEKILTEMEAARGVIAVETSRVRRRLRLGVSTRARQYILPAVLPQFEQKYPNTMVVCEGGDFARHFELLKEGALELAFTLRPADAREFHFVPLFEDELKFVFGPGHPWATLSRVTVEDLADPPLMFYSNMNRTPELLEEYYRAEGIEPRPAVGLASLESIKQIVMTGKAVGVLAPWFVRAELESGELRSLPLGPHRLERQWGITYASGHPLTVAEESLIDMCKATVAEIAGRLEGTVPTREAEKKSGVAGADGSKDERVREKRPA
ncbi:MAG: LysR family transcriptional regulator [Opitutus sp.]